MLKENNVLNTILVFIFFLVLFYIGIKPLQDPDIWFHLKSGELIAKNGLIFHDIFSFTAQGREWIPYEWLFQVFVYQSQGIFGLDSIKYIFALINAIQIGFLFLIFRKVFKLNLIFTLLVCFFSYVSTFEFLTARPHMVAYTFFVATFFLVLKYYFDPQSPRILSLKNSLIYSLPVTLLWSNLHGSMFLSPALLLGFASFAFFNYLFNKPKYKNDLSKSRILGLFGFINLILTILPPLGLSQYKLLIKFYEYREVLTKFIDEWTPLYTNTGLTFIYYISVALISLGLMLIYLWKTKSWIRNVWLISLIPFPIFAFVASRNAYLGYLCITIFLGWLLSKITLEKLSQFKKVSLYLILGSILILQIWILNDKKTVLRHYYPVNSVNFIQKYKPEGNMFNEYSYGGYLLYYLYPQKQVFFDGRTEMYLCCEMPDTMELAYHKQLPDPEYAAQTDRIWNKYNISFALISSEKHTLVRKIARVLSDDPNWALVFWDDDSQIFIRKDGKNDDLIKSLGTEAATPYNQNPYREGMEDKAFEEYQRMIKIVDSSKSRNAIGYIYLKQGKFGLAKAEFIKAAELNAVNESPLMNLAELGAKDKDYPQAIELYERALKLAPDRGLIYTRLGQLYLQNGEDISKAKDIWQKGVENTVDEDAKKRLQELLAK